MYLGGMRMKNKIYLTKNGYVYSFVTGKLFLPSQCGREIITSIKDEEELQKLYEDQVISEQEKKGLITLLFDDKNEIENNDEVLEKLQLVVTNICNLQCDYCYEQKGQLIKNPMMMTPLKAKEIIDFFFKKYKYIKAISFFGGEPLMNVKTIEEICRYLADSYSGRYGTLFMISNFYEVTSDALEIIKKYKIKLTVSLDGNSALNCHRKTKNLESSFYQVAKNIIEAKKVCTQPEEVEVTMSGVHNRERINTNDVALYMNEMFSLSFCSTIPVDKFEDIYIEEDTEKKVERAIELYLSKGIVTDTIADMVKILKGSKCREYYCSAGIKQFTIMPDGKVYPCQIYANMKNNEFCFGNISNNNETSWNEVSDRMYNINNKLETCSDCEIVNFCTPCAGQNVQNGVFQSSNCLKRKKYYEILVDKLAEVKDSKILWSKLIERIEENREQWNII